MVQAVVLYLRMLVLMRANIQQGSIRFFAETCCENQFPHMAIKRTPKNLKTDFQSRRSQGPELVL
ncbi:MAG: hypothetical protein CVV48_10330 [Spirochaetae bacterium HGW-Spirochaetae-4]|nr:MAG: hypothetical protein CVV48_10330 [Spirochaetae bacterium HGW-Spirochaetae-4]